MSKRAYEHGVVIMRCDGCARLHLVADRLGWFRDGGVDIEQLVRERGQSVESHTAANSPALMDRIRAELDALKDKDVLEIKPPES